MNISTQIQPILSRMKAINSFDLKFIELNEKRLAITPFFKLAKCCEQRCTPLNCIESTETVRRHVNLCETLQIFETNT